MLTQYIMIPEQTNRLLLSLTMSFEETLKGLLNAEADRLFVGQVATNARLDMEC